MRLSLSLSEAKKQKNKNEILWPVGSRVIWNAPGQIYQGLVWRHFISSFNAARKFTPLPNLRPLCDSKIPHFHIHLKVLSKITKILVNP